VKKREEYFIANDFTAINIVREVAAAFGGRNNAPVSSEVICSKLDVPAEFGEKLLGHLVKSGLLMKTSDPKVGFVPAKEPANIRLSDIAAAVAEAGFAQSTTDQPAGLEQIARSQRNVLAQYSLEQNSQKVSRVAKNSLKQVNSLRCKLISVQRRTWPVSKSSKRFAADGGRAERSP